MTHLEIENLASDYLEGLLEPSQRAAVEAHLSECVACRELIGDVRHALEVCRAEADMEPRPWLVSQIMLATVGERKPTWRERIAAVFPPRAATPGGLPDRHDGIHLFDHRQRRRIEPEKFAI